MNIEVTKKQKQFLDASADEVLYGGAAGGGKSYGQLVDAFLDALKYPGIRQLILRNSFPELKRSLILVSVGMFPQGVCNYNESSHVWKFRNGSLIEFGYLESDKDVQQYQSAEYDKIRFDELTHFTEFQYTYMISRVRGANKFPKQVKSSTNPGSQGHQWVKMRFIDVAPPGEIYTDEHGRTRQFIPAKVQENRFLMAADPGYIQRLEQLPENQRKALLEGEWDIFEGQYYPEFRREIHTLKPFTPPHYWKRFISLDYGLDMTAAYWWAIAQDGKEYIYRELYESGLKLSDAAKRILEKTPKDEQISYIVASPDLWNRRQDTGKSGMEIMQAAGLKGLRRADDRRIPGWRELREHLATYEEEGETVATLRIFDTCHNLIRTLPMLQHDEHDPEDAADKPHEVTHGPESIRYGAMSRPMPTRLPQKPKTYNFPSERPKPDPFHPKVDSSYINFGS